MRALGLLIILVSFGQVLFAQVDLNQRIDFTVESVTLEEALAHLKSKTSLRLAYSNDLIDGLEELSLSLESTPIKEVLDALLRPYNIGYKEVGSQIVLYKLEEKKRRFTLSGFIIDEATGEKLIAANVYHPESRRGAISNNYGFFSITLEEGNNTLVFSYLGYQSNKLQINLESNHQKNIMLKPSLTLAEVLSLIHISEPTRPY